MRVNGNDLIIIKGDTEKFRVTCDNYTLTSQDKVSLIIRTTKYIDEANNSVIYNGEGIIESGTGLITLPASVTSELFVIGKTYYYDLQIVFANGEVKTPLRNCKFSVI